MGDEGDPREPDSVPGASPSRSADDDVSVAELFRMLANGRRRRVLWYLLERPRTTLGELADILVGWRASEGAVVGPDEHEAVLISLHHADLPLLEEAGLLEYDRETGAVRFPSHSELVRGTIRHSYRYERGDECDGSG